VRITVAEPLDHRAAVAREALVALALPLLVVVPLALVAIVAAVRTSIAPVRRFRERLEARNARDLSAVPAEGLPAEVAPLAATLNALLNRLKAAFEAERAFAANAAHELRTPLAGAIAQAQRLQAETDDAAAGRRAADIEASLKRLTRMSERLLQLARAEGGRLRLDRAADLRGVARIVLDDLERTIGPGRISSRLPERPVLSDLDPDAFGIICRNLVENAVRHGSPTAPIDVTLDEEGLLRVANEGPVIAAESLGRLVDRFERGATRQDGSGLGLAIVSAIAERIGSRLVLESPRPGRPSGFEASLRLPLVPE
jgi:two-component system OmpR family sensor kinase